jgi:hypothetical protein
MAIEAAPHPGQLIASGELQILDGAMTLGAANAPRGVERVIEDNVGFWQR